jgi:hypothetical protein
MAAQQFHNDLSKWYYGCMPDVNDHHQPITDLPVDSNNQIHSSSPQTQKPSVWILAALALTAVVFGIGGWWVAMYGPYQSAQKVTDQNEETTDTSTSSENTTSNLGTNNSPLIAYIENMGINSLNLYDVATKKTQVLVDGIQPKDGALRNPQWIDQTHLSYVKCEYPNGRDKAHYCDLIKHNIQTNQTEQIIRQNSFLDQYNSHGGGEIIAYRWSPNGKQIAYVVDGLPFNSSGTPTIKVMLHTLGNNQDLVLDTMGRGMGRDGGNDDENFLSFSPDSSKLLLIYTLALPAPLSEQDRGSVFVYDLKTNKNIWQAAGGWSTYGRWLDNNNFVMKSIAQGLETGQPTSFRIFKVNPAKPEVSILSDEGHSWYNLVAIDANTVLYTSIPTEASAPLGWGKYEINSQKNTTYKDKIVLMTKVGQDKVLVQTTRPCALSTINDECNFNVYHNSKPNDLGLLDIKTGTIEQLHLFDDKADFYLNPHNIAIFPPAEL